MCCLWWNVHGDLFSSAGPLIVPNRSGRNANRWGLQKTRQSQSLVNCPLCKCQQTLKQCVWPLMIPLSSERHFLGSSRPPPNKHICPSECTRQWFILGKNKGTKLLLHADSVSAQCDNKTLKDILLPPTSVFIFDFHIIVCILCLFSAHNSSFYPDSFMLSGFNNVGPEIRLPGVMPYPSW